jgi:putative ABC transport system permease protein
MKPPALARHLLWWTLPGHLRREVVADLDDEYLRHIVPTRSAIRARLWYWRQAIGSIPSAVRLHRGTGAGEPASSRPDARTWVVESLSDLRHGLRLLRRQPAFAIAAVTTLGLGIAGTTAVFTVTHAVLLRPLPYGDPDRLVTITERDSSRPGAGGAVSHPDFLDYRAMSSSLESVAGHNGISRMLAGAIGPRDRVSGTEVTDGFFAMLGVRPALGRDFEPADMRADAPLVAIVTDGAWRRRFGSDQAIVGRTVRLSGEPTTIVGVLPRTFQFPLRGLSEIWLPARFSQAQLERSYQHWLDLIGRLRPAVTIGQATTDLDRIARGFATRDPRWHQNTRAVATPLADRIVGPVRPILLILLAAAVGLLAAACASIGGLLVARGARRVQEMTIRGAIGGSSWRLIRQLIAEGVAIAIPGGVLGLLVGQGMVHWFVTSLPARQRAVLPHIDNVGVDTTLLVVTTSISLLTAIAFSALPAWQASRPAAISTLRVRGGMTTSRRLATIFVTAQLALALVLLSGAGLVGRSVHRLMSTSPGFRTDGLLTARVIGGGNRPAGPSDVTGFHRLLLDEVGAVPGVTGVATISQLPLTGPGNSGMFKIADLPPAESRVEHRTLIRTVSANYFEVMGIPLRQGRSFSDSDRVGAPRTVLVNQALADGILGGAAIGRPISFPFFEGEPLWTIVGVVGNEQFDALDQPMVPVAYFPYAQTPEGNYNVVVRVSGDVGALSDPIRARFTRVDPNLPAIGLSTLNGIVNDSDPIYRRRSVLMLVAGFAATALLLAVVGLYAMVSQSVAQRTREIGIRVALGAGRPQILRGVVRRGLTPLLAGLLLGVPASLALGPSLRSVLFGVSPTDLPTLAVVVLALAAIAGVACVIPATRAVRVDPVEALRQE